MQQLFEFKKQAERIKKELEQTLVEVSEVNGIKVVINGAQEFRTLEIDPGRLDPSQKAGLELDLLRALNAAITKSQEMATHKMSSVLPKF